ncbi:MAG TPA: biotin/lipoyl-containing protein [Gemmatimonadales bacterium]|nr:biotin/lipoyl-containing protein [Gemmatimonadales bacterium]
MKYFVAVGGKEVEVEVDGDQVTIGGRTVTASLDPLPGTPLAVVTMDGRPSTLPLERLGRGRWIVSVHGERHEIEVVDERTRHIRSLAGSGATAPSGGVIRAPMPGLVVRIQVEVGQRVAAGTPVAVLEAMKMENQLKAPAPGVVRAIHVRPGDAVEKGKSLIDVGAEPEGDPPT